MAGAGADPAPVRLVHFHAAARLHHRAFRFSALSGAAHHCASDPALVRWVGRGLDHLHGVLSGGAAGGVFLFRLGDPPPEGPSAGYCAYRPARPEPGLPADHRLARLQARRCRPAHRPHPAAADAHHWSALPDARHHRPAGAGLVHARVQYGTGLSALRLVQSGLDDLAGPVSAGHRAAGQWPHASHRMVAGLWCLCDPRRPVRLACGALCERTERRSICSLGPRSGRAAEPGHCG